MDFGLYCIDCCKTCNSTCQKHKPIVGQGDSKSGHKISSNQSLWSETGKVKKLRSGCVQEKKKSESKAERQNKLNLHYNCYTKNGKKTESKLKQGSKQEKDGPDMIKKCNVWNHFLAKDLNCKTEKCCGLKEPQIAKELSSDKLSKENITELEEKIDFLARLFECHVRKISNEDLVEKFQTNGTGSVFGDFWQLFRLNKRMCAAEEGIEKLTLMLEEFIGLIESSKKKDSSWNDNESIFRTSVDFEEMTIGQKIDFLKKRNDILTNFMKTFLGINSLEEICSKLDLVPKERESSHTVTKSKLHFGAMEQPSNMNREQVKTTGVQVNDFHHHIQRNSQINESQNINRTERRDEQGVKYSGNKLGVISEQSELVGKSWEGKPEDNLPKNNGVRHLKGKFSQVSENSEPIDSRVGITEVISRLLTQEAFLKSSLNKVHYELFSKLDSNEQNFLRDNLSLMNNIQFSEKEDNFIDTESHFDSLSEISFTLGESDNDAKSFNDNLSHSSNAFEVKKENGEAVIQFFNNLIPAKNKARKRNEEDSTPTKNKYPQHIVPRPCISLTSPQKTSRIGRYVPEQCSTLQERRKRNKINFQRPVTMPNGDKKLSSSLSSSKISPRNYLKPLMQSESLKRHSAINSSLKNKNKILISKKSFVQAS